MAPASGEPTQRREQGSSGRYSPPSCTEWRVLWRTARPCGAEGCRPTHRAPPCCSPDASCRSARAGRNPAARAHDRQPSRLSNRTEQAPEKLHGDRPEPDLARRPDLHQDRRRLASAMGLGPMAPHGGPGCHHRHAQGRRLEHARDAACIDSHRGSANGRPVPPPRTRAHSPQRSRGPICSR